MYEGNPAARCSRARGVVNQTVSRRPASRQRRIEVGHSVTDMVNARTALCQESADGAVRAERREQFDLRFTEGKRYDGRSIGNFRGPGLDAQHIPVERQSGVQVGHCNSDMGNAGAISHRCLQLGFRFRVRPE